MITVSNLEHRIEQLEARRSPTANEVDAFLSGLSDDQLRLLLEATRLLESGLQKEDLPRVMGSKWTKLIESLEELQ